MSVRDIHLSREAPMLLALIARLHLMNMKLLLHSNLLELMIDLV